MPTRTKRRGRVAIGALALVVATSACTPEEAFLWNAWHREAPTEAEQAIALTPVSEVVDGVAALTPEQFAALTTHVQALEARTPCERGDAMIDAAGLPEHFHGVMRRESGCNPLAHNPSGASGALQVMPMWADDCGTTPSGLFDLWTNIRCGVHIYAIQGGGAWSTW